MLTEIDKLNKQPATTGAAIEAFNKKVRKVERRRDEQYNRLRDLAVESMGTKAVRRPRRRRPARCSTRCPATSSRRS